MSKEKNGLFTIFWCEQEIKQKEINILSFIRLLQKKDTLKEKFAVIGTARRRMGLMNLS